MRRLLCFLFLLLVYALGGVQGFFLLWVIDDKRLVVPMLALGSITFFSMYSICTDLLKEGSP